MNNTELKSKIFNHLSDYKANILKIAGNGEYRGKRYSHILPKEQLESNFLKGVNIPSDIHLHMYAHHLNSSQVMCINFFQPLTCKEKGKELLLAILAKAGAINLPTKAEIEEVTFEKVFCAEENTNFDFYVKLVTGEQVFIEIKYTEDGFGKIHPDKNNPTKYQDKWENVYKNHIRSSLLLKEITPSDFYANYQIWRNVSYIKKESDYVVFLFPFENEKAFKEIQNTVETGGKIYNNVNAIDWTWITDIAIELSRGTDYYEHFNRFKEKYLAFNT